MAKMNEKMTIELKVQLSLWNAIKIRIAGKHAGIIFDAFDKIKKKNKSGKK